MSKKKYVKPRIEDLVDTGIVLMLTASQTPENPGNDWNARQQDNFFAEDDDYEE